MEEVELEIDAVKAVYLEDVIEGGVSDQSRWLRIRVLPDTAFNEAHVHANVCVRVDLGPSYPQTAAEITLEGSVGLSDDHVQELQDLLAKKTEELRGDGEGSVFELLSVCKDFVNDHNIPSENCCICMCPFDDTEPFVKASCAHAFHCECLAHWVHNQRVEASSAEGGSAEDDATKQGGVVAATCAVCRQPIQEDRVALLNEWLDKWQREREEQIAKMQSFQVQMEAEERRRRLKEQEARMAEEIHAFKPKPLVVIEHFEHNNVKLLRHAMLPFGATECRIIRSVQDMKGRQMQQYKAAVWFPCMEKALKAVRTLCTKSTARIAHFYDMKSLPPDLVNMG